MPIWSVQFYDETNDFRPSRYGVVKADNQGTAFILVKEKMGDAQRADVIQTIVRDESAFQDGYRELSSN
jgi:hypothetical protein